LPVILGEVNARTFVETCIKEVIANRGICEVVCWEAPDIECLCFGAWSGFVKTWNITEFGLEIRALEQPINLYVVTMIVPLYSLSAGNWTGAQTSTSVFVCDEGLTRVPRQCSNIRVIDACESVEEKRAAAMRLWWPNCPLSSHPMRQPTFQLSSTVLSNPTGVVFEGHLRDSPVPPFSVPCLSA
jgi:hypothetical protein